MFVVCVTCWWTLVTVQTRSYMYGYQSCDDVLVKTMRVICHLWVRMYGVEVEVPAQGV